MGLSPFGGGSQRRAKATPWRSKSISVASPANTTRFTGGSTREENSWLDVE
jgi:hypothetical protein